MPRLPDLHPCELKKDEIKYSEDEDFISVFKFVSGTPGIDLRMMYGSVSRKFFIYNQVTKRFSKPIPYFEARATLWRWRSLGSFNKAAEFLGMDTRRGFTKVFLFLRNWLIRQGDPNPTLSVILGLTILGFTLLINLGPIGLMYPITTFCVLGLTFIWGFVV